MIERGRVYWAFADKRRPVLVLSPDVRNRLANDLLVAPLSSRLRYGPTHVHLRRGEAGLPTPCIVKCEQITTLARAELDPSPVGAALSPARMVEVERAVLRALGIPI